MSRSALPRDRLLEVAERLVYERGYEAVGVAELCQSAGIPKGSFYHWWGSKQALTVAMLDRAWRVTRERIFEPAFGDDAPVGEQLDRYTASLAARLDRHLTLGGTVWGCLFGNLAAELSTRDAVVRARVDEILDEMRAIFAAAIRRGIDRGELDPDVDPETGALGLCAHMEGLMVLAKASGDPRVITRLAPDARRLLGLRATPSPHPTREKEH